MIDLNPEKRKPANNTRDPLIIFTNYDSKVNDDTTKLKAPIDTETLETTINDHPGKPNEEDTAQDKHSP